MEAHMVRRADRPLQVRVSFEATRLSPQHLIEAYARLVPIVQRTSQRANCIDIPPSKVKTAKAGTEGER
jgi:hypothetical protein